MISRIVGDSMCMWAIHALTEYYPEAAFDLGIPGILESRQRAVAIEVNLAFQARTRALLAPFAIEGPATEQVLLQ